MWVQTAFNKSALRLPGWLEKESSYKPLDKDFDKIKKSSLENLKTDNNRDFVFKGKETKIETKYPEFPRSSKADSYVHKPPRNISEDNLKYKKGFISYSGGSSSTKRRNIRRN